MSCQGMDSPQIPHRGAELPRCLHLRRAGPMEAIPVGVPPGQLSRSLVNPMPVSRLLPASNHFSIGCHWCGRDCTSKPDVRGIHTSSTARHTALTLTWARKSSGCWKLCAFSRLNLNQAVAQSTAAGLEYKCIWPRARYDHFMPRERSLATVVIDEKYIKPDAGLNEKYQAFSSELLRISLSGIRVFGFLYKDLFNTLPTLAKMVSGLAMLLFGFAAAAALGHRYYSTDASACQIRFLRLWRLRYGEELPVEDKTEPSEEESIERNTWKRKLHISKISIAISSVSLAVASILLGFVFLCVLLPRCWR